MRQVQGGMVPFDWLALLVVARSVVCAPGGMDGMLLEPEWWFCL